MHDKNGNPVKVGDTVTVEFVVRDTSTSEEYCNCTLDTAIPMYPSKNKTCLVINTKQCEVKTTS